MVPTRPIAGHICMCNSTPEPCANKALFQFKICSNNQYSYRYATTTTTTDLDRHNGNSVCEVCQSTC